MEPPSSTTGGSGGGGGPAPFLLKTYEMVDDTTTDEIVSWNHPQNTSFIVWNPPEFARLLLSTYFKHNNFSSFIRQLNTYGFHKIDPERWEFANEDFIKDKKHLLKNIHRRKPIHSHSQPPPDPERVAFEEEIEKLTREKNDLDARVSGFKMHHCVAKSQLEDITERLCGMEQRQEKLLTYLQKAVQNPAFIEHIAQKIEAMDLTAYNKKRRLPRSDLILPAVENKYDQQDVSNKLKLELSTAVSNMNLISNSTHSSNEDWASPTKKSAGNDPKNVDMGISTLAFATETVELLDTGTCPAFQMDPLLSDKVGLKESSGFPSLQPNLVSADESESLICCQLNLSLASSPVQPNQSAYSSRATNMDVDVSESQGTRLDANGGGKDELGMSLKNVHSINVGNSSQETQTKSHDRTPDAPARINDQFWEQFLTERPGSSDTEEASSSYKALPSDDQDDGGSSHGMSKTAKNLGKLTL